MINKEEIRRAREIAELAKKAVPGPWEVMEIVKETDDGQKYPDGYAILGRIEGTDSPMTRFADVGGQEWGENEARLIAAAPEMAALLAQMADRIEALENRLYCIDEAVGRLRPRKQ